MKLMADKFNMEKNRFWILTVHLIHFIITYIDKLLNFLSHNDKCFSLLFIKQLLSGVLDAQRENSQIEQLLCAHRI